MLIVHTCSPTVTTPARAELGQRERARDVAGPRVETPQPVAPGRLACTHSVVPSRVPLLMPLRAEVARPAHAAGGGVDRRHARLAHQEDRAVGDAEHAGRGRVHRREALAGARVEAQQPLVAAHDVEDPPVRDAVEGLEALARDRHRARDRVPSQVDAPERLRVAQPHDARGPRAPRPGPGRRTESTRRRGWSTDRSAAAGRSRAPTPSRPRRRPARRRRAGSAPRPRACGDRAGAARSEAMSATQTEPNADAIEPPWLTSGCRRSAAAAACAGIGVLGAQRPSRRARSRSRARRAAASAGASSCRRAIRHGRARRSPAARSSSSSLSTKSCLIVCSPSARAPPPARG